MNIGIDVPTRGGAARAVNMVVFSTHGGHGVTDHHLVDGQRCLNVGCDDDGVLSQV